MDKVKEHDFIEVEYTGKLADGKVFDTTNKEIADALEYDDNTLKRKFEIFLIKGRANLKQRLKKKQIQVAMSGNVAMLIWLGKQYLDQSEKVVETGDYQIVVKRKAPSKK